MVNRRFVQELESNYAAIVQGKPISPKEADVSFRQYLDWQQAQIDSSMKKGSGIGGVISLNRYSSQFCRAQLLSVIRTGMRETGVPSGLD